MRCTRLGRHTGRAHIIADVPTRDRTAAAQPATGVDTLVWLAADDGAPLDTTGLFWLDRRPRPIHRLSSTRRPDTAEERDRLWDWCIQRSGFVDDGRTDLVR